MQFDPTPFFERYEKIVQEVDSLFEHVRSQHPDLVTCGLGCSDCCHAMFDLSLIEAMYISHHFRELFAGMKRSELMDRADEADRTAYKLKRQVFKASEEGRPASEILAEVAAMRVRCPLLDDDDKCALYDQRPITCRLYGIPTNIGGEAHTCGLSGFEPGKPYPAVNMDKIQDTLMLLSQEMVAAMKSKHGNLAEVLVPVSMAMMNEYDKEYLGLQDAPEPEPEPKAAATPCNSCDSSQSWVLGGSKEEREAEAAQVESCKGCPSEGNCNEAVDGRCPTGGPQGAPRENE